MRVSRKSGLGVKSSVFFVANCYIGKLLYRQNVMQANCATGKLYLGDEVLGESVQGKRLS